jgi:hypothetical protein
VEHLFGRPDALPRLTPSWEKRYLDLLTGDCRFQSTPLPLAAIYVLSDPQRPADEIIEEIPRSAAMMHLLANIYVSYLLDGNFRRRDFVRIAKVVNTIAVRKINLRHNFVNLEQTCRSIVADLDQARSCNRLAPVDGSAPSSVVPCRC